MIALTVPNAQGLKGTAVVVCSGGPTPNSVEFYLDGDTTPRFVDSSSPFQWSFNTTQVSDGPHRIKAIGRRASRTMTAYLDVVVANNAPVPPPPTPTDGWFPAPPSSYKPTGVFSAPTVVDTFQSGDSVYALYHPMRRNIVKNSDGVRFFVYDYRDENDHAVAYWRLKRRAPGATSWQLMRDSGAAGDPNNGGVCPSLEIDGQDNIYVTVSQYKSTQLIFRVFKWSKADNYSTPQIFNFTTFPAANKWTAMFDQVRNWLWLCSWERGSLGQNDLLAMDQNGVVKVQKQVMTPYSAVGAYHAGAEYAFLDLLKDGTLIRGWCSTGQTIMSAGGPLNFYDIRYIYSPPGANVGLQWYGPDGALTGTCWPDDTGPVGRRAFGGVVELGAEFMPATDPDYWPNGLRKFNYNNLTGMAFNDGALHFQYNGTSSASSVGPSHRSHARVNWATKAVDKRTRPMTASGVIFDSQPGAYVRDTTLAGRILFIGNGSGADYGKIIAAKTDNNGDTWELYAKSALIGSLPANTNAVRFVGPDGKIDVVTAQYDDPHSIIHLELSPV